PKSSVNGSPRWRFSISARQAAATPLSGMRPSSGASANGARLAAAPWGRTASAALLAIVALLRGMARIYGRPLPRTSGEGRNRGARLYPCAATDRYPPAPPNQRRLPAPTRPTVHGSCLGSLDDASARVAPRFLWHGEPHPNLNHFGV